MKAQVYLLCTVAAFTLVIASPAPGPVAEAITAPDTSVPIAHANPLLEKRKGCSGNRLETDDCTGKKLQKQNSFHNW